MHLFILLDQLSPSTNNLLPQARDTFQSSTHSLHTMWNGITILFSRFMKSRQHVQWALHETFLVIFRKSHRQKEWWERKEFGRVERKDEESHDRERETWCLSRLEWFKLNRKKRKTTFPFQSLFSAILHGQHRQVIFSYSIHRYFVDESGSMAMWPRQGADVSEGKMLQLGRFEGPWFQQGRMGYFVCRIREMWKLHEREPSFPLTHNTLVPLTLPSLSHSQLNRTLSYRRKNRWHVLSRCLTHFFPLSVLDTKIQASQYVCE